MITAALKYQRCYNLSLVEFDIGSIGKILLILDKMILDSDDTKV